MVGTERQVLARIYIVADSLDDIVARSEEFRASLRVVDAEGRDMVLAWATPESLM
jgi:hypothetical protein